MLKKNDIITLEITDISSDGSGVGKYENMAVFVPSTALGDVCKVKILKVLSSYCYGKTEEIITSSRDRINPECPNFYKCGGCDFMHISYEAEKTAKKNFVKNCFERIGKITDVPVEDTVSEDKIYRYRNKAQFPVRSDENGKAVTGFFAQRSHRIIPCFDCLLQPEILNNIAKTVILQLNELKIPAYNEENISGIVRHIYMRIAEKTNQIMLCLVVTKPDFKNRDILIKNITEKYPQITSVVLNVNSKNTNVILGEKNILVWGKETIQDVLCGVNVTLSPHSFYQVNRDGAEKLYTIAKDLLNLNKDDILLDLYCGAGTIGLSMAEKVKSLVGVEIIPQAIENAKYNADINGINNARFICSDAGKAAQMLLEEGYSPTAVIMDPARKGCDQPTLDAVLKMSPERIAMISCNPSTAARDCKYLSENGYQVRFIQPFDMFPRTKHVETVVQLFRKTPDAHIDLKIDMDDLI